MRSRPSKELSDLRHLLLLPSGDAERASTRYRVLAHIPAFHEAGFSTEIRFPLTLSRSSSTYYLWRTLDLTRDLRRSKDVDLLFIQRKLYPAPLAPWLSRSGRPPMVFDMDDALDLPPPRKTLSARGRNRYRRNFLATVTAADLVLCGNRNLADRLPHDRFEILPTAIDTNRFTPGAVGPATGPILGWVGHTDNIGYLESLSEPLLEVARRHPGLRLVVVAERPPSLPGINVEFRRWNLDQEINCFRGIRIGLMPLDDSPWTQAKCAFKAIQYMALGIPTVASPVGMNREVIQDGTNGFLPGDSRAWVEVLDSLLSQPAMATRIGAKGRITVERSYSLTVVSRRLVEILSRVASRG